MTKYFVKCTTDWMGTECYDVIEADTLEDAKIDARDIAQNNYESFSNIWDDEQVADETDGLSWIDGEHYDFEIEEYNPEKHDRFLMVK